MKHKRTPKYHSVTYVNRRTPTLYMVSVITVALSIFTFYMVFSDLDRFFIEYSSRLSGIFWMVYFFIAGNIMFICMLWLSGRYVLQIKKAEEGCIYVKTWSIIGLHQTKKYPNTILDKYTYKHGKANFIGAPKVNAPWLKLKTPKGRTLIVDIQGHFLP